MVLEIRLSNFYSINDEIVLDFRAAKINTEKSKSLSDNIIDTGDSQLLKIIALYGANASGKSNIIKSIQFCNALVFESHLNNENTVFNFKPFKFGGSSKKPSSYFIRFLIENIEYEYSFSLNQTEIITESLYYYPNNRITKIFDRDERRGKSKSEKYSFGSVLKRPMDVAENTSAKTLYISRASQMDRDIAKDVFLFFYQKFILNYLGFNAVSIDSLFKANKTALLNALKIADSDIVDIQIKTIRKPVKNFTVHLNTNTASVTDAVQEHLKITTFHKSNPKTPFDFFTEESAGTIKLFIIMLTIIDIVKNDKILMIDEIELSLHPEIIEYIFKLFNTGKNAQLLCTTHNTNFLNLNKLRKDQIWFVNKKDDASTDLYSLYDFGDFRDTMDLEKAYLMGRFDAKPFIDDSVENLNLIFQ